MCPPGQAVRRIFGVTALCKKLLLAGELVAPINEAFPDIAYDYSRKSHFFQTMSK